MALIMAFYKTDTSKIFARYPFKAVVLTSPSEDKGSVSPYSLIPQSISVMLLNQKIICPTDGINPRWLEIVDTKQNHYRIDVPQPWLELPYLAVELAQNPIIHTWFGHGEKIPHWYL